MINDVDPNQAQTREAVRERWILRDASFVLAVCGFELFLGLLGLGLAWVFGLSLTGPFQAGLTDITLGLVLGIAYFIVMVGAIRLPFRPVRKLLKFVDRVVAPLFRETSLADVILVATAAGVGEELFFRIFLQQWIGSYTPAGVAIVAVGVAFAVCHPFTLAYASVAFAFAIGNGIAFYLTGSVVSAVIAHALYDALAILYLVHRRKPWLKAQEVEGYRSANRALDTEETG